MLRRSLRKMCAAPERMKEEFDVVIVGGGPGGLSTAIKLKQMNAEMRVGLVEKGSMVGAHTLSGACIETHALDELLPDWKTKDHPIKQEVTSDAMYLLTKNAAHKSPLLPATLHNHGNYIVSLGAVCKFLGEEAEALGVEIYPGFAAADLHYKDETKSEIRGVILNDTGIKKNGEKGSDYDAGMIFEAKQTVFAEGCRGSCTKKLEEVFGLRKGKNNFQSYGLGIKEVWEIPKEHHNPGQIIHTIGWPLTKGENHDNTYGGSFIYHYGDQLVSTGFVVALDYKNPHTRPYMEMQKWKTHPFVAEQFKGGKPISYGARTIVEGGLWSLPKLDFPGGVLVGDCAGFLNLPKIKGTHCAMKSGMLAAEAIYEDVLNKNGGEFGKNATSYETRFENSWLYKELHTVRNCRQMFAKNFYLGAIYTGVTSMFTKGMEPFTLPHHAPDHKSLKPAANSPKISYPKPDNVLTFDLLTNHSRSGTNHNGDQPAHLKLKKNEIAVEHNLKIFDGPEAKYCPAQVYEFVEKDGKKELVINAQNCLHCKACDIKDPTQNINWTVPEGGGGPNYNAAM